jgi:hypothetical protein
VTDGYINRAALAEWNLANQRAIMAYRVDQGYAELPGGLNYRHGGILPRPVRGWLLDALAAFELAKAQVAVTNAVTDMALRELGVALKKIERLEGGQEEREEA